jgi:hypothetical protein
VGQVFETLWQLFVILEHGTCLHYVVQLGNLFVSESFEFHVSSYSFDSFKENLWLSSRSTHRHTLSTPSKRTFGCRHTMVIITLCLDPCLIESNVSKSISCHAMFKGSINLTTTLQYSYPCVSLSPFDHHYSSLSYICFMSLMGDTSWPSFDESIPVDFNTLSRNQT